MKQYTFIFEFNGGTYVSQVVSNNVADSVSKWAESIDDEDMTGMTAALRQQLNLQVANEDPVLLDGMNNVWCLCFTIGGKASLLNIVGSDFSNND
ncbi:MAG: hypothetical protein V4687_02910 [Bacteroidota bacterium]